MFMTLVKLITLVRPPKFESVLGPVRKFSAGGGTLPSRKNPETFI